MILHVKILLLLVVINATPAVLMPRLSAFRSLGTPMDLGRYFSDGRRLLGSHKTMGGFALGVLAGALLGYILDFSLATGFAAGGLSMAGDSLSSFIKRRFSLDDGKESPGLDQAFQGGCPLVLFKVTHGLSLGTLAALMAVFVVLGIFGARLYCRFFLPSQPPGKPVVRSNTGFKQWRACHIALSPVARLCNFESVIYYRIFMQTIFKLSGLYTRGVKNALNIRVTSLGFSFKNLPEAFECYKILFISDLHIDGLDGLDRQLIKIVSRQKVDLCLLGGDYRMEMYGPYGAVKKKLVALVQEINATDGIFGILGNHDCIEIAPDLEDARICMLINESMVIEKNGQNIFLCGVDDPHYYQCHDLDTTMKDVPGDAFSILLAHSPEIINGLGDHPVDLCLCGHTHGGQVCLPVFGPVFSHCPVPRQFISGRWRYGNTHGYTSCGAGSSGVPVRYNCPPEVVILTLTRKL
ncbi:putative Ser/Thr phosphatase-family protein [Desulforapulum autotrophicum HRM2]|uniref:Ser/Thr phosphatase-family protein n=1 Tax=Desulforapulum autotrophicum (strain ATCC 43914 / DSM 3382 / VKM B-1955 / HRM2) TaxID=177437 RepID=C0QFP6_DESAH|nr:CDP-archaeol synthase [Desulforapulum autotrophicum]ACN15464.1 putative Ser/Thr phosphatase-family protein [Desulforapulum autotrophicum HRM2]